MKTRALTPFLWLLLLPLLISGSVGAAGGQSPRPEPATVDLDERVKDAGIFPFPDILLNHLLPDDRAWAGLTRLDTLVTVPLEDAHGFFSVRVPLSWNDVESGHWQLAGEEVGYYVTASPDLTRYERTGDSPGLFLAVSTELASQFQAVSPAALQRHAGISTLLGSSETLSGMAECRPATTRTVYRDYFYEGAYDLYLECRQKGSHEITLVALPAHQEFLIFLRLTLTGPDDLAAATRILDTFQVRNGRLIDHHHEHVNGEGH